MRIRSRFRLALLLLAGPAAPAQALEPQPRPDSLAAPALAVPAEAPRRLLLKVGLNAGRTVRWSGYEGLRLRLPVTAGAEYALSPKFTVYGQLSTDFWLVRGPYLTDRQQNIVQGGALGIGPATITTRRAAPGATGRTEHLWATTWRWSYKPSCGGTTSAPTNTCPA